jgi:hypothetical protein
MENKTYTYKNSDFKQVEGFYNYLVKDLHIPRKKAGYILRYLQESIHLFPDHLEICHKCGKLFDEEMEGGYVDYGRKHEYGKFYCEKCMPYDYAVELPANFACNIPDHKKPVFNNE